MTGARARPYNGEEKTGRSRARTEGIDTALNEEQLRRYARHFPVPEIGREGQEKLLRARVLIIGAGEPLAGSLLTLDLLDMEFQKIPLLPDPDCPVCGGKRGE